MFAYRHQQAVHELLRDQNARLPGETDNIVALECWKHRHVAGAVLNTNYRLVDIACDASPSESSQRSVEATLKQWLVAEEPYRPLPQPPDAGPLRGTLRIVLCERPNLRLGMSMSYRCFSLINDEFKLHQATLPLFCADRGGHSFLVSPPSKGHITISIVIKFPQKVEIANYILSLTYNLDTRCTNALICGAGVLLDRESDSLFGSQRQQIIDAILLAHQAWDNPLMLPFILLDTYSARLDWRAHHIDLQLSRLESRLGVTFVGKAGRNLERQRWPEGINTEEANIDVQTISTHLAILSSCTQWAQDCLSDLLKATQLDYLEDIDMLDLTQCTETLLTITKGVHNRFTIYTVRATLQSNVLFNVISQQDSIATRQDTRLNFHIARSSKRDSTSLMTFTFITALFLPGTFVATVFSMSMFNFDPDNLDSPGVPNPRKYVSNKFWLFWAIAVPLTLITIGTWYSWSRYANQRWQEELRQAAPSVDDTHHHHNYPVHSDPSSTSWTGSESAPESLQLALVRRRSATAGVCNKDEIRTWWMSPGLV